MHASFSSVQSVVFPSTVGLNVISSSMVGSAFEGEELSGMTEAVGAFVESIVGSGLPRNTGRRV
jgi:hypothetical protein